MTDPRYWIWLNLCFIPGSSQLDVLMQHFNGDPKAVYNASAETLSSVCNDTNAVRALLSTKDFKNVNKVYDFCERENVGILTPDSRYYPSSLTRITGRPPVIYYKGKLPDFENKLTIAIVGTRKVTSYGSSSAYTISHDLSRAGATVVSGMALGADTAAHRGALDAKGHTVAFLGCGIDVVYPKENAPMMREIISSGTVMTEFPPGSRPEGWHFPIRNRLISGISNGILVVEAAEKSGALITASHGLKQGKLVYAIPGKVGELTSTGTNLLIRNGAKMVTSANDIISDFKSLFKDIRLDRPSSLKTPYTSQKNTGIKNPDISSRSQTVLKAAQPRPIVVYKSSEEEDARSYMSFSKHEAIPLGSEIYGEHRLTSLSYPSGPIPAGGYEINLTDEKVRGFDRISNASSHRRFDENETFKTRAAFSQTSDLREIRKQIDLERQKTKSIEQPLDISGLSETEVSIVKFVYTNGKTNIDTLSVKLNTPVNIILSCITMLEIKQRITQLPGGYVEIKK